jgi:hypothetical protein
MDEGQIGLDLRAPRWRSDPRQASLGQDSRHGAVVHMQLARDRANAPFFDMIIAQDLRLQIGRDGSWCSPRRGLATDRTGAAP